MLLWGSGLVTLAFFVFFATLVLDARQEVASQADQDASNIATGVEQEITRSFESFDQALQAASDGLQLPEILDLSPQIRNLVLFNRVARTRYLGFINVLSETGDVIADSRSIPPRAGNYAGTDYFIAHRRDPRNILFIGGPILTRPDQPISITVSRRLSHPDGSFAGVVVGSMQLAYFRDIFSRLGLGPHGMITLLRTDGTILMRMPFDPDEIGHKDSAGAAFYTFMQTRNAHIDAATVPAFDTGINNPLRRFTYRQVGELPLVLSVAFATDDIFAAWRTKAAAVLLGGALLCLVNLGLAALLRRQVHRRAVAEADYRHLSESASDIITRIDADGVCRYASAAAWRVLGIAPGTLVGHRVADALAPDDRVGFDLWLARLLDNTAEPMVQFRARHSDGSDVWIEAVARRLNGAQSVASTGFVILLRDITVRHQLDVERADRACDLERTNAELDASSRRLIVAADEADAANDLKLNFLQTIGHEIRTPLNAILGHADMLAEKLKLDPVQTGHIGAIRGAVEHLDDLVNRSLQEAGVEIQAGLVRAVAVDLPVLLEQTRAQIEPEARAKDLLIRCEIDHNLPHTIITDGTHLRQILLNLLNNAVKFTDRGEIVLRASRDADRLRCSVVDTGRGVPADQRVRLFREFERLVPIRAEGGGSGLGLSIATKMARGLGGSIGYSPNPEGGSVFWVELPLGVDPAMQFPATRPVVAMQQRLRVLVVDESSMGRDTACGLLRAEHHTVTEAASGEEAVRLATTADFDVVLMDMRMPDMDGVDASRRIRAVPSDRGNVPIIAVTAQVLVGQWGTWVAAGVNQYLPKPYNKGQLLTAIALALSADRAADTPPPPPAETSDDPATGSAVECGAEPPVMDPETLDGHLRTLSDHTATLLAMLRHQDEQTAPGALAALVHRIAGDAGQLGFTTLSATARNYMVATDRQNGQVPAAAALLEAAAQAEASLHQRLSASRNASMASAKLM